MDLKQAIAMSKPKGGKDRRGSPDTFIAAWSEPERMDGREVKAFVLILRTRGCVWSRKSGCSFCGYSNDTCEDVTAADLDIQFGKAMERYQGEPFFKFYTSGSFLDDTEVPPDARHRMLSLLEEAGCRRVLFESLPTFVTEESLTAVKGSFKGETELALGLESSNDAVLERSINKSFRSMDYSKAANLARSKGLRIRTYIVIKPPFLSERDAVEDAVASAELASVTSDVISFNPINVQRGTLVERLWRRDEYSTPWLWSVIEVLRRSPKDVDLVSAPTAGGRYRGAHNCGSCDEDVLALIARFSLEQDRRLLEDGSLPECRCQDTWRDLMELEGLYQTWAGAGDHRKRGPARARSVLNKG